MIQTWYSVQGVLSTNRLVSGGMKYIASCSGGKDSLAMVLKLIELEYPLDEVISYVTDAEFRAVVNVIDRLKKVCEQKGIKYTILKPDKTFYHMMTEKPVMKRNGGVQSGYRWCGGTARWGTAMKLDAIEKHNRTYGDEFIVEYVGVAADETHRINRNRNGNRIKLYPLVEWNMTEAGCLEYCYSNGWHWNENGYELYDLLDRVSCKWCRNKNLKELRNIYHFLPEVWQELKDLQDKVQMPYKDGKTINDLELRFATEDMQMRIEEFLKE